MDNARYAKVKILVSMFIFGTISIVVRGAALPSAVLALGRSIIGSLALILYSFLKGKAQDFCSIRKNIKYLIPSGIMLGLNWVLLFESYNYVSVATATLCYYMAPIFLVIASPFVFNENLTVKKLICIFLALIGMVFVSGVLNSKSNGANPKGIFLGVFAAILYASIIICNKRMTDLSSLDRVSTQLIFSIPALIIYILITNQFKGLFFSAGSLIWLLIAGIIHTGLAYVLMYGSLPYVSSQTAAILSYLDTIVAVIVSVLFFNEHLTLLVGIGAVLVLGAAIISEHKS